MDVADFCTESAVLVVAGKGGVGKTTLTAALARMAASVGLSVLVVELEGKSGISTAFGSNGSLQYEESGVSRPRPTEGSVRARRITPDDALLEYLADHGMKRISKRLLSSGAVDVVSTAIPGIRDVLVLGKVKQLEQRRETDLIVVDAPATGHAVTFLTSASGLLDAARGGPIRSQAAEVVEMLGDPARCRVVLVTLPEELPVSETVEAAFRVEDQAGVQLGPVIVNACHPEIGALHGEARAAVEAAGAVVDEEQLDALEAARQFRLYRHQVQTEQIRRLAHELPLPQLHVPALLTPAIGPEQLDVLAAALADGIAQLADGPPDSSGTPGTPDLPASPASPDLPDDASPARRPGA